MRIAGCLRRDRQGTTRRPSALAAANAVAAVSSLCVLALAGCAQPGPPGGAGAASGPCNAGVGALVGGLAGALAGGLADRNHRTGTLIGAGVGAGLGALACVAYNYRARQTRSAAQVGDDYRARSGNPLPDAPLVTTYRTEVERASASRGDSITVTSNIEVVPGRTEPLRDLHEDFAIIDPDGHERTRLTKTPAPAGSSGGAYVATLQFTFPKDIPNGTYQVQSQLFVNGQPAGSGDVKIQVARVGGTQNTAWSPRSGAAAPLTKSA